MLPLLLNEAVRAPLAGRKVMLPAPLFPKMRNSARPQTGSAFANPFLVATCPAMGNASASRSFPLLHRIHPWRYPGKRTFGWPCWVWRGLILKPPRPLIIFCPRLCAWHEVRLTVKHTPWYLIFPGDPAITEAPQGAMYPTWPGSSPPPQSAWAQQQMMPPSDTGLAAYQGYPQSPQGQPSPRTAGTGQRPAFQPVSNSSTSVPSYWFAR